MTKERIKARIESVYEINIPSFRPEFAKMNVDMALEALDLVYDLIPHDSFPEMIEILEIMLANLQEDPPIPADDIQDCVESILQGIVSKTIDKEDYALYAPLLIMNKFQLDMKKKIDALRFCLSITG